MVLSAVAAHHLLSNPCIAMFDITATTAYWFQSLAAIVAERQSHRQWAFEEQDKSRHPIKVVAVVAVIRV